MIRVHASRQTTAARHPRKFTASAEILESRRLLSAGDLDLTFSGDGYAITQAPAPKGGIPGDRAETVEMQPDGKILEMGYARTTNSSYPYNCEVVRLTPAGALDSSFGTGGRVQPFNGTPGDMAIQSDGRIVLVGAVTVTTGKGRSAVAQSDLTVVRLLANGSLDSSFGQGGKVVLGISSSGDMSDYASAVAIQADGKIVVGGYTYGGSATDKDSLLVRFNGNGTLDTTFGQGGKVVTAWSSGEDLIGDLLIQGDGRIVVTGKGYQNVVGNDANPYFVARYNANGSLDDGSASDATPGDSFGTGGTAVTPFGGRSLSTGALALQPDGALVFARHSFNGADNDIALARFTPSGALDTSFGGDGAAIVDLGGNQVAYAVAVQGDGKIVVAGSSDSPATGASETLIARFQADGSLDAGFGSGGSIVHSVSNGPDVFGDVALQADGKIVAVGSIDPPTGGAAQPSFLAARFLGDPAALRASTIATTPSHESITTVQARPLLAQALAYWRSRGEDTSRLGHIDLAIADLGGTRLGEASGTTITLDDNAAGWGWDVARVRRASGRMDLRAALIHEVGHLLGHGHAEGGVMAATLAPRTGVIRGR